MVGLGLREDVIGAPSSVVYSRGVGGETGGCRGTVSDPEGGPYR